jgi:hypothetical protein
MVLISFWIYRKSVSTPIFMSVQSQLVVSDGIISIMKKFIITASAIGAFAVSGSAFAEENEVKAYTTTKPAAAQQMHVNITPGGEALIRGTITAVNGNVLSVKSWGGEWMIRLSDSTEFNTPKRYTMATSTGSSTSVTPVKFVVGDFIGVQGKVSANASWSVDAKYINNRVPVPMPRPMPYPVGTSTVYCIKAPCPVYPVDALKNIIKDNRDVNKEMEKVLREGLKLNNNNNPKSGVQTGRPADAETIARIRAMLELQIKSESNAAQKALLQQALDRLNMSVTASSSTTTR